MEKPKSSFQNKRLSKRLSMQKAADTLRAVILKEDRLDGLYAFAVPLTSLNPYPAVYDADLVWEFNPTCINVTQDIDPKELLEHPTAVPVYPRIHEHTAREFGRFLYGSGK